ncbi:threonine synthase, partial [candidate division KSB1 bacterium]
MKIHYYSTNRQSPEVNFSEALFAGQAPDKGLYMPDKLPVFTKNQIQRFRYQSYQEIAFTILRPFLCDVISDNELNTMLADIYDFDIPIELVRGSSNRIYVMRLDRGPTASFKDFAARFLSRTMERLLDQNNTRIMILVATSGDTGGAVADAFFGNHYVNVAILFPENEVSFRQRKQLTTYGGNIHAVAVKGTFDDCQHYVKKALASQDLKEMNLASANSINIGRLLPQSVYYFYAHSRIAVNPEKEIIFSVPSGNFGNLIGGILAKKMGLPVKKLIAAVNENDEFPVFLKTGKYSPLVPSRNCLSNAMNVGHPSNLARLIDIYGGHIDEDSIILKAPNFDSMRKDIFSCSVSDKMTNDVLIQNYQKYDLLLEPHGAVGLTGLTEYFENGDK